MNNSLQRDVDTLAHLLKENREDVSNELLKYSDEESFMRMQLMLREYFKKEKKRLQQEIEREAQLILTIFPDVDVENLKELLHEAGDHPNRSKVVIKQLSSKNGIKRAGNKSKDEHPISKKFKRDVIVIKEDDAVICVDDDDAEKDNTSGSVMGSKDESEVSEMDLEEIALNALHSLAGPSGYSPPNNFQQPSSSSNPIMPLMIPKHQDLMGSPKTQSISSGGPFWSSDDEDDYETNLKSWHAETNRMLFETETFNEKFRLLREILPDADPVYLQEQCKKLIASDPRQFDLFVSHAIENRNYPTIEDNSRLQNLRPKHDPTELYTTKFNVSEFLEVIPDPETYFDKKRVTKPWSEGCAGYAAYVLSNMYDRVSPNAIVNVIQSTSNFLAACDVLDRFQRDIVQPKHYPTPLPIQNISLLQEIAFKTHHTEIMQFITMQRDILKQRVSEAKNAGTIQTCICCYNEDILPEDMFECEEYCRFCKECIRRSVEISYGNGKLVFECLNNCRAQFTLNVLEKVLPLKLFSKISYKKQMEEVKAAGIENLEFCPFCDFAAIPAQENKIFSCLNPECMKESCRLCKEPSHIPYRCDEVEKDENVQARTYIENKMTEALLKKCYQCSKPFIKDDGCNMITCSCGAKMCYLCEKIVTSYDHFNGLGGENFDRCPLYTDNLKMSEQRVNEVAQKAKKEIITTGKLKIDPTADIPNYFQELRKKRGAVPHLQVLQWMEGQNDNNGMPNQVINVHPGPANNPRMGVRIVFSNRQDNNVQINRLPERNPLRMSNAAPIRIVNTDRGLMFHRGGGITQHQIAPQPVNSTNLPARFPFRQMHQLPMRIGVNPQPAQALKRVRVIHKTGSSNLPDEVLPDPIARALVDYKARTAVSAPMDLSMSEPSIPPQLPIDPEVGPSNYPYFSDVEPGSSTSAEVRYRKSPVWAKYREPQVHSQCVTHHREPQMQTMAPPFRDHQIPTIPSQCYISGHVNRPQIIHWSPTQPGPSNQLQTENGGYGSQATESRLQSAQPGPSTCCTHAGSSEKFQPWN